MKDLNTYHLYSTKWDIDDLNSFIIEYYIDSHYSLLFESRVFKGLNIYWPSTVVIFLSLLASELIFVASSDHSFFQLSKIFVQGPKSHVHNYFANPQLHSAWSVSPQRWPTSFVQMGHYSFRQCLLHGWLACPGVELKLPFWAYRQWFESEVERSFHWGP